LNDTDIVIAGLGMITSVGLTAAETSASVRARTTRVTEVPWFDRTWQPFKVAEVLEDGLPELTEETIADASLTYREARLLRLGSAPLAHALKALPLQAERPGLALALPSRETAIPMNRAMFLARLARQSGNLFALQKSNAQFQGRAGGLQAAAWASETIRSGATQFMIVGGIDCYRDPYILAALDVEGRVKSEQNMDGLIPGEGAGFLLLASRASAQRVGLPVLAGLSRVTLGFETGHLYSREPYRGEGLAATLQRFFAEGNAPLPIADVFSSMNGESHWAKEWGVSYLRNREWFLPEVRPQHPADCYGDTGSACGPLMMGLAALGQLMRFRSSPALIYCSSDSGNRAAVAVIADRN
jgi:3-oxoacyl-[acyl-carrier-protein] synthase-1